MALRYQATDYLYATARVRAVEGRLVGREKLNRLLELKDRESVLQALAAGGVDVVRRDGETDADATLDAMLREGFLLVREAAEDPTMGVFLQYPYDCNNIKALLKCRLGGKSAEGLACDLGSVEVKTLEAGLFGEDLSFLPAAMAAAVPQARAAYAETGNPQEIDFILDRACFADMAAAAAGLPFAARYVAARIDAVNLMTAMRLSLLWGGDVAAALLSSTLIEGGTLEREALLSLAREGAEAARGGFILTPFAPVLEEKTLADAERRADDIVMSWVKEAKNVTFGAEVPIAYLIGLETAVKNLRILLAGKAAALPAEVLRGRMRECYV